MSAQTRIVSALTTILVVLGIGFVAPATSSQALTSTTAPSLAKAKKVKTPCQRLKPRQRVILRKALNGKRLTPLRCKRYASIVRAAAAHRARIAKQKQAAKLQQNSFQTVFGLSANGETALRNAEQAIGLKAGVVGVFADFKHPFPTADANFAAARGASLLISWEPWDWEVKSQNQPDFQLDRITAGHYDEYIKQFARDAAATKRPVFVRFAAEMNGDWHVWSTGFNGNGPGDYIAAHRHVVDVARAAGGTNIKWMFNPIVSYEGSTPLKQLYPGHNYVDWVALDGYNWGALKWGWQSFNDIFTMGFKELKSVAPNKPVAIAEIGSVPGSAKAAWVADAFAKSRANGVRMLVWFEHNKETDWRLSSNANVARAARAAATQSGWISGGNYNNVKKALGL